MLCSAQYQHEWSSFSWVCAKNRQKTYNINQMKKNIRNSQYESLMAYNCNPLPQVPALASLADLDQHTPKNNVTGLDSSKPRPATPSVAVTPTPPTPPETPQHTSSKQCLTESQTRASKEQSNLSETQTNKFLQLSQLQMEVERLSTLLVEKNKEIRYLQKANDKRKSELIELEKNVSYYEGRLTMMEDQLLKYEGIFANMAKQCDDKARYESQVHELVGLFEGYRKQNEQMNGKIEQKCYQLNKLTEKYLKLKNKLKNQVQKPAKMIEEHSQKRRSISLTKKIRDSHYEIPNHNSNIIMLNAKIRQIEGNITKISKENEVLFQELQDREQTILKLKKQLLYFRQGRSEKSIERKTRIRRLSKKRLNTIPIPQAVSTLDERPYKQDSKFSLQLPQILHKLKLNLLTQQLSLPELAQLLASETRIQYFTQPPFSLSHYQSEAVLSWVANISTWQDNLKLKQSQTSTQEEEKERVISAISRAFGNFRTVSIKGQYLMKINVFNVLENRWAELMNMVQHELVDYQELQRLLQEEWGLRDEEIDVTFKSYFEATGDLEFISLPKLWEIVQRWHSL